MWRPATQAISGTNEIPLGENRRRFGPAVTESQPVQLAQPSPSAFPRRDYQDRGREEHQAPAERQVPAPADDAPRKKRSRWGDSRTEIPGLPTAISAVGVSQQQLDNYAIQLRLEEINRKLRLNQFIPPENERSPSPPPLYDGQGRRTNTREVRYRKKLEDERVKLVEKAMKNDPLFRPPIEFQAQRRSTRPQDKVYIPVKEFPEINFFGLLVGPRGNSLKKMERESGAKISIRGKGSVKEGKGRPDAFGDDMEEDLHCLVMADSEDKVQICVRLINQVIETAASTPEGQNDHKRNQLRELAALNGTLRDDENQICQNCGGIGHRRYDCPEVRNFTANVICRLCGNAGHMARDCLSRPNPNNIPLGAGAPGALPGPGGPDSTALVAGGTGGNKAFDSEYASLMAELGESTGTDGVPRPSGGAGDITAGGTNIPPWRRPEVWNAPGPVPMGGGGPGGGGGFRPPPGYGGDQGYGMRQQQYQGQGQPGADPYAQYYQGYGQGGH